jgi:transposase
LLQLIFIFARLQRADSGGELVAAMYSLIFSARLDGMDAQVYLRYVLIHIADHPVIASMNYCPAPS